MSDPIYQLIYVSSALEGFSDDAMFNMLINARRNNEKLQITGFLLYSEGTIIQLLEGKKDRVENLFNTIKSDTRHKSIVVLHRGEADLREFNDWSMGFKKLNRLELAHDIDLFNHLLSDDTTEISEIRSAKLRLLVQTFRRIAQVPSSLLHQPTEANLIISQNEVFVDEIKQAMSDEVIITRTSHLSRHKYKPANRFRLVVIDANCDANIVVIAQKLRLLYEINAALLVVVDKHYRPQIENELFQSGIDEYIVSEGMSSTLQQRFKRLLEQAKTHQELKASHASLHHERAVIERTIASIRSTFLPIPAAHLNYLLAPVEKTNGDLLLYKQTKTGKSFYLIADFQGHGLRAAVASPVIANLFHFAIEHNSDIDGATLLIHLNHALCHQLPAEMFMACVLLESNHNNKVRLWNAGMPEPILFSKAKQQQKFSSQFLPMGISAHETYANGHETVSIHADDTFFVFSDGAIDCTNEEGDFLGSHHLAELYTACIDQQTSDMQQLFNAIRLFSHDQLADDVSLVSIKPYLASAS